MKHIIGFVIIICLIGVFIKIELIIGIIVVLYIANLFIKYPKNKFVDTENKFVDTENKKDYVYKHEDSDKYDIKRF
jgi:hypothetical protein